MQIRSPSTHWDTSCFQSSSLFILHRSCLDSSAPSMSKPQHNMLHVQVSFRLLYVLNISLKRPFHTFLSTSLFVNILFHYELHLFFCCVFTHCMSSPKLNHGDTIDLPRRYKNISRDLSEPINQPCVCNFSSRYLSICTDNLGFWVCTLTSCSKKCILCS